MLAEATQEALQPGFHGHFGIDAIVADGTIQSCRRIVERTHRR